jgi:hypothetical protein
MINIVLHKNTNEIKHSQKKDENLQFYRNEKGCAEKRNKSLNKDILNSPHKTTSKTVKYSLFAQKYEGR